MMIIQARGHEFTEIWSEGGDKSIDWDGVLGYLKSLPLEYRTNGLYLTTVGLQIKARNKPEAEFVLIKLYELIPENERDDPIKYIKNLSTNISAYFEKMDRVLDFLQWGRAFVEAEKIKLAAAKKIKPAADETSENEGDKDG